MLGKFLRTNIPSLTFKVRQSIVVRYQNKKSLFDKTSYNPEWIPK
jgi:hypothetical protein